MKKVKGFKFRDILIKSNYNPEGTLCLEAKVRFIDNYYNESSASCYFAVNDIIAYDLSAFVEAVIREFDDKEYHTEEEIISKVEEFFTASIRLQTSIPAIGGDLDV